MQEETSRRLIKIGQRIVIKWLVAGKVQKMRRLRIRSVDEVEFRQTNG